MCKKYKHILVVDDDNKIRTLISEFIQKSGFVVSVACDPVEARNLMGLFNFDLIVVDVMMPREDGITFVKRLRASGINLPVLMLTALGEVENRITGLKAGVDDYLPKPFDPQELLLRINSILRRSISDNTTNDNFVFGFFLYNFSRHELKENNKIIYLTECEINLLEYFISNRQKQLSRDEIASAVGLSCNLRGVDVLVTRLRKKIEKNNNKFILTLRNIGYKFVS